MQAIDLPTTRTGTFLGKWHEVCAHCGKSQQEHREQVETSSQTIEWRKPCEAEKALMQRSGQRRVKMGKAIVFVGWILIPLAIAVLGFTSAIVGACGFAISLIKVFVEGVKLYGNPDKWLPGHKAKMEKQRKMAHYYWHCERNPVGFAKIKNENLEREAGV